MEYIQVIIQRYLISKMFDATWTINPNFIHIIINL
jgi:hypothetical protein